MAEPTRTENANSGSLLRIPLRVLRLAATHEDMLSLSHKHLVLGLMCTWLVGMGRYWDNPRAGILQHLGVGSVVYVFVLGAVLWLVGKPFGGAPWTYLRVLTLVVLASPPAAIYALPVEHWYELETAQVINMWFLAIVAAWRMAIWVRFAWLMNPHHAVFRIAVALLPVAAIVTSLSVLNLDRAVFEIMAIGENRMPPTEDDTAYAVLLFMTVWCDLLIFPVAFIAYSVGLTRILAARKQSLSENSSTGGTS